MGYDSSSLINTGYCYETGTFVTVYFYNIFIASTPVVTRIQISCTKSFSFANFKINGLTLRYIFPSASCQYIYGKAIGRKTHIAVLSVFSNRLGFIP